MNKVDKANIPAKRLARYSQMDHITQSHIRTETNLESEILHTCKVQCILHLHNNLLDISIIIFLLQKKNVNCRSEILNNLPNIIQLVNG